MDNSLFNRTELLLGREAMERIRSKRVIIFGVGGVGSWCAECLVREGIEHLTLVDSDVVCVTNCNRQLMATTKTIGEPKVEALRRRLLDINPEAEIVALQKSFSEETAEDFEIETFDYVIDAIDSLKDKISLIIKATSPLPAPPLGECHNATDSPLKALPQRGSGEGAFFFLHGCCSTHRRDEGASVRVLEGEGRPAGSSDALGDAAKQALPCPQVPLCPQRGAAAQEPRHSHAGRKPDLQESADQRLPLSHHSHLRHDAGRPRRSGHKQNNKQLIAFYFIDS